MKMTFADLVKARRLEAITPSRSEIADLLDQAARSLEDARRAIAGKLSPDWQFMIAYAVPLSLAAVVIRSEGYRTMGKGHHATLFQALAIAIPQLKKQAGYFTRCRRQRNLLMYERPGRVTPDQVARLVREAEAFEPLVHAWLVKNYPTLSPPAPPPRP
jgi:hypothetical protein